MEQTVAVEKQAYREAMARLGAAVNVITTDGPGGRAGFTASAVCSVTDTPPTLLVCANRTNDSYPAMKANTVLCVNTLAGAHEELSPVFAGHDRSHDGGAVRRRHLAHTGDRRAGAGRRRWWRSTAASTQIVEVGTHDVFICSVEAVEVGTVHEGLIYYARGYHRIAYQG